MMHRLRFRGSTLLFAAGIGISPAHGLGQDLEENKALVRQWIQDVDEGSLDYIDKWMTSDFQVYVNSPDPTDLAGYRQMISTFLSAFELRHEIHYMVAENNLVAAGFTLHMVHTGEYQAIAPTGRSISIEGIVVVRLRDGKIVEEWLVADFAALQQQLEAPAVAPQ